MTFVPDAPVPTSQATSAAVPSQAWQSAAGQKETAARLRRLPPGLKLGDELDEPIYFDAARQFLLYRGFMFHASYTFLHKLSGDPEYQTAIDQLFVGSAEDPGRRSRRLWGAVASLAAALALVSWLWPR